MNKDIKYIYDYLRNLTSLLKKTEKEVKTFGKTKEDIASMKATITELKSTIKDLKKIDKSSDIADISAKLLDKMAKYHIKDDYWYFGEKKLLRATGYSVKGDKGQAGRDGKDGTNGKDGLNGKNAKNGLNGRNGKDGKQGKDGLDGKDGKSTKAKNIKIGKVTTVDAGTDPSVIAQETKNEIVLDLEIPRGPTGGQGRTGNGVVAGGTTDQVLAKASDTNYDTKWVTGGGGTGAVDSVNTQTGVVVLDTDDIEDTATNRYTNDTDITRLANTEGTNTGDQVLPVAGDFNHNDLANINAGTDYEHITQTQKDLLGNINQDVKTTASPTFEELTLSNDLNIVENYAGLLGTMVTNTNDDAIPVAGAVHQMTNDLGYWGLIGMTSSASTIGSGTFQNTLHFYNQGYNNTLNTIDGNKDFVWGTDPTDNHNYSALSNEVMRLTAAGNLSIEGTVDGIDIGTDVPLNTTHRTSNGSDHTFIDQSVVSGASPTFDGNNFTGIDADDVAVDTTNFDGILSATDVDVQTALETIDDIDSDDVSEGTTNLYNQTHTGDVTGSEALTIGAAKVTEAMQVLADNTTNDVSITKHGYVPKAANTGQFLKDDGTWATPAGSGNVSTSGTPVANDIPRFVNGTDIEGLTYAELKDALNLEIGSDVQAYAANLSEWSGVNPSTNGKSLVSAVDYAAMRTLLNIEDGATANSSDATLLARANHTGTQTASTISDFDTEVANNSAVALNTDKITNVTTNLSEGTSTTTTVDVNSSDGTNATLVSASTSRAGLLTKAKFDEIVVNNGKDTNVSTDLSLGTKTATTMDVNSSDGTDATLIEADTTNAGLLGSDKWDEIVANTLVKHDAVTVADTDEIDMTLTGQEIKADIKSASIDETKLDTSVNASLDLADTSVQNAGNETIAGVKTFTTLPQSADTPSASLDLVNKNYGDTNYIQSLSSLGVTATSTELNYVDGVTSAIQTQLDTKQVKGGWNPISVTLTYSSADDPTYVVTTASDLTDDLSVGMKIFLTNASLDKYFIITAITSGTITLYGGTDFNLANSAITAVYYSTEKAPYGFNLSKDIWSVIVTDITNRSQSSPTASTWYNLGSVSIDIPIGAWEISYSATMRVNKASASPINGFTTLSTSASSESDVDFTTYSITNSTIMADSLFVSKELILTTKDTYYINARTTVSSVSSIDHRNSEHKLIIRALCSYL